ncbi:uncharacterized protein LOC119738076 [Patiria miniata]|uniref:Uncharacterized protein n=1 Tax=Patiria miniata TaxID=46514 RepID=A0A914AYY0_PATMI|nr:uncharacterized protein LOC119738076 [Patiria miniata]
MKLLALFTCVAFLYGFSAETPDWDNSATDDSQEEPATAIESNDLDIDDDDNSPAIIAVGEWDEQAALNWAGQTDDNWDEAHTLAWLSDEPTQVSNALDSGVNAVKKGLLTCSCSRARRDCRCCFRLRISNKRFNACLVAYYSGGHVGVKATLNSRTIINRYCAGTCTKLKACRRFLGKRVCVGLTGISRQSHAVSANARFWVRGVVCMRSRRITIPF